MLAKTPPMGWNSWNTFASDINEQVIFETADAIVEKGLDRLGYKYVVIDDCWALKERDPATGRLVADPEKFPHGMKYVADYIHSKGLLFGMYSCVGIRTCAGFPGSYGHEFTDAEMFAEIGVDFLKYDYCYKPSEADGAQLYRRMGMALRNTGRDIVYSVCNWGKDSVHNWARAVGGHMYRSTPDIFDCFSSVRDIALSQENNLCYSAPGCFNDLDMLTVGMYGSGLVSTNQFSDKEYRTQFALWCLFASPLMLGCDIRQISDETLKLITNETLIRINQDPEARPAMRQPTINNCCPNKPVYFRFLSNNEYALGMFNFSDEEGEAKAFLAELGLHPSYGYALELTDAFTGKLIGCFDECFIENIAAHSCRLYTVRIIPAKQL